MAVNGSEEVRQLTEPQLAGHLFRRAGFGATRDELEVALAKGYEATLEELLHPEQAADLAEGLLFRSFPEFHETHMGMAYDLYAAPVAGEDDALLALPVRDGGRRSREPSADGEPDRNLPPGYAQRLNVYVADWRDARFQVFDAEGRYLATIGSFGTGAGQFRRPAGLSIDSAGHVIVADWGNERVQILRPDGTHLATLRGDATLSKWAREFIEASPDVAAKRQGAADLEAEKRFWGAVSVRVDRAGRLYVAEHSRHRIQIYKRVEVP